jgi:hypothetical protein
MLPVFCARSKLADFLGDQQNGGPICIVSVTAYRRRANNQSLTFLVGYSA